MDLCELVRKEFAAKEKLEIVNFRGGAAHFCPATSEPRKARRGNSVRAILRIHRIKYLFGFMPNKYFKLR